MTKDDYKKETNESDYEIEQDYKNAVYNFDTNSFRDITDYTENLDDFQENADFGQKAHINEKTYYKVINVVDDEPYTIYFEEDELRIL